MKVEVEIRNGRTAFRFAKRGLLLKAIERKPADRQQASIPCEIRHNVDDGFIPGRVRFLSANSISYVLELPEEES